MFSLRSRRSVRRLAGFAVLLLLALVVLLWVSRRRAARPEDEIVSTEPQPTYPMGNIDRERSERLRMLPPADTTTIPEFPLPPPPPAENLPPVEEPPDLAGTSPRSDSASAALTELALSNDAEPTEMALRPRVIVHPDAPEKLIRKKKINAAILLQALVGSDGRVHDVRWLRGIDDCAECTTSAIEAVKQYRYDPPPTRSGQVWTTPIEIRFSYGR